MEEKGVKWGISYLFSQGIKVSGYRGYGAMGISGYGDRGYPIYVLIGVILI